MVPSSSLNPNGEGGPDSRIGAVENVCTLYVYRSRHRPVLLREGWEGGDEGVHQSS